MTHAEIQRNAKLRKLAKLLWKRERLVWRMADFYAEEGIIEKRTAHKIEEFLAQKKG